MSGRARKFKAADFERFDYVLAMDRSNLDDLAELASAGTRHKLALLRRFDPSAAADAAVPDPYYGGDAGFDEVIDMCLRACAGLLEHIRQEHGI